jgi:hypothetical protein
MTERKVLTRTHYKPKPFVAATVSAEELEADFRSRLRIETAFYQPLFLHGFASPGNGGPWVFRRDFMGPLTARLKGDDSIVVFCRTPEQTLEHVRVLSDAIDAGKTRVHRAACCPLAEIRPCVCDISFRCPIHGDKCHGTHE